MAAKKDSPLKLKQDAEGFANQQAAMFVRESWLVGYMKKNAPNVQYAVAPLPAGKKTNTSAAV